jgi:uncharacterized protein (TIGR03083 family)
MDPWVMIKADRESLAEYLGSLSDDEWAMPSLCSDGTVKEVAAHMLVPPTYSKGKIFLTFLGSGFNLDKMSAKFIEQMSGLSGEEIAAKTAESAGSQSLPPGLKLLGELGEVVVHSADISEAVGRPIDIPMEHYVAALDYMKDVKAAALGCQQRIAGLKLSATDTEWTAGVGPLVEGKAIHLLSAMTGRQSQLDELTGDGVEIMRTR